MNKNENETVVATAPEMKPANQKTWAEILAEKVSKTEAVVLTQYINRNYPEISDVYAHSELIPLLSLNRKYNDDFEELMNEKQKCCSEIDEINSLAELYPQILDKCPEIKTDNDLRYSEIVSRHQEFNTEFIHTLRTQQNLLDGLLENNLAQVKELSKNNKQTRADEEANPNLKEDKMEKKQQLAAVNKELKKELADNNQIISIFRVKEIIESKCNMILTRNSRWEFSMEYKDDDVLVRINDTVRLYINGSGWVEMGTLRHFSMDKFLESLPKKYWVGKNREQQINSILDEMM